MHYFWGWGPRILNLELSYSYTEWLLRLENQSTQWQQLSTRIILAKVKLNFIYFCKCSREVTQYLFIPISPLKTLNWSVYIKGKMFINANYVCVQVAASFHDCKMLPHSIKTLPIAPTFTFPYWSGLKFNPTYHYITDHLGLEERVLMHQFRRTLPKLNISKKNLTSLKSEQLQATLMTMM